MIGFIGVGNMAGAIISGLTRSGVCTMEEIGLFDPNPKQYERFKEAVTYPDAVSLVQAETIVFFSVKPQVLPDVLEQLKGLDLSGKILVSICAAVSTDYILSFLPTAHVVRAMPNTPMLYGKGVCALSASRTVETAEFERVRALFEVLGLTVVLPEEKQNAVISVTGSSPAYLFALADAMAQGAKQQGFSYEDSVEWIAGVFEGVAEMLRKSGMTPARLKQMVCSPGGTTLAAIEIFEEADFTDTVCRAMAACTRRAEELSK